MSLTRKQKRLAVIGGGMAFLALATTLTFVALGQRASYFVLPGDLKTRTFEPGQRLRLGGLVEQGSVQRGTGATVNFGVSDNSGAVKVTYTGILPDLFREGQGVITEGTFQPDGVFKADSVLAKHDENYMPKEVADRLKKEGLFEPEAKAN